MPSGKSVSINTVQKIELYAWVACNVEHLYRLKYSKYLIYIYLNNIVIWD